MHSLLYNNFLALIQKRPDGIGWHWRGDATLNTPTPKLGNVPLPLRKVFKELHNQLLQWHSRDVSGTFYLPDTQTFNESVGEITLHIQQQNREGLLYVWLDPLATGEKDERVETFIFVDKKESNFCHLVIKKSDGHYIPTEFGIDDFLSLLAHTRGINGLYYALAWGCDGCFIHDLFALRKYFPDADIELCLSLLEQQQQRFLNTIYKRFQPECSVNVQVKLDLHPYFVTVDNQTIGMMEVPQMAFDTFRALYQQLCSADFDEMAFKAWSYFDYVEFGIIQLDRHNMLIISQFYNEEEKKEALCDARSFYKAFMEATAAFLQKVKTDAKYQKHIKNAAEWRDMYHKFTWLLRLLFGLKI